MKTILHLYSNIIVEKFVKIQSIVQTYAQTNIIIKYNIIIL